MDRGHPGDRLKPATRLWPALRGGRTLQPVAIKGTVSGPVTSFDGSSRLGLELETMIDRTAFGLDWNAPLPTAGFAVGNAVKLHAELELVPADDA